jgi:hypothetical protein
MGLLTLSWDSNLSAVNSADVAAAGQSEVKQSTPVALCLCECTPVVT